MARENRFAHAPERRQIGRVRLEVERAPIRIEGRQRIVYLRHGPPSDPDDGGCMRTHQMFGDPLADMAGATDDDVHPALPERARPWSDDLHCGQPAALPTAVAVRIDRGPARHRAQGHQRFDRRLERRSGRRLPGGEIRHHDGALAILLRGGSQEARDGSMRRIELRVLVVAARRLALSGHGDEIDRGAPLARFDEHLQQLRALLHRERVRFQHRFERGRGKRRCEPDDLRDPAVEQKLPQRFDAVRIDINPVDGDQHVHRRRGLPCAPLRAGCVDDHQATPG